MICRIDSSSCRKKNLVNIEENIFKVSWKLWIARTLGAGFVLFVSMRIQVHSMLKTRAILWEFSKPYFVPRSQVSCLTTTCISSYGVCNILFCVLQACVRVHTHTHTLFKIANEWLGLRIDSPITLWLQYTLTFKSTFLLR